MKICIRSHLKLQNMNDNRATTLEALPLEMLDMILMKAVLLNLSIWFKAEPAFDYLLPRVMTPLRMVGSGWNYRLTTRWFKIILRRHLKNRTVSLHFVNLLPTSASFLAYGITKLDKSICVLSCEPKAILLYMDKSPFDLEEEILIEEIQSPHSIVSFRNSQRLYVTDKAEKCIWKITRSSRHVSKWLTDIDNPFTMSVSDDNRMLVLRDARPSTRLEFYASDAVLVRHLPLPGEIWMPLHAIQRPDGNLIVSHWKKMLRGHGKWVISRLTSDGQVIGQFCPRDKLQELQYPRHLCEDLNNLLLFVADYGNDRILLFDSKSLSWRQILLTNQENGVRLPRLCFDESNRQLIVGKFQGDIKVFAIN